MSAFFALSSDYMAFWITAGIIAVLIVAVFAWILLSIHEVLKQIYDYLIHRHS